MRLRKKPKQSKTSPYLEGSIGDLMEPPHAVFMPEQTVGDAIDALREMVKTTLITYAWVLEADGRLVGVVTMRDLLFSERSQKLRDVMLKSVFALKATTPLDWEAQPRQLRRRQDVVVTRPVVRAAPESARAAATRPKDRGADVRPDPVRVDGGVPAST